ncbi:class I SAM-dependent methyltransferase [Planktomarina temperata]|nr:class I SAM-dependent methyltransferase [Planktomarina temperata]
MRCIVCKNDNLISLIKISGPLARYGFETKKHLSLAAKEYKIDLVTCQNCGHIFNQTFDISNINYSSEMISEGRKFSKEYTTYMQAKAHQISDLIDDTEGEVVEIGSGDSYFISLFEKHQKIGFEPSSEAIATSKAGLTIYNEYFDPNHDYGIKPSVLILRHVLEHLHAPFDFMKDTVSKLEPNFIFLEVPNGAKTKSENRVQDIYYEHRSYFTTNSLACLIMKIGYEIESVSEDFNSEIISLIARKKIPFKIDFSKIDTLIDKAIKTQSQDSVTMIWGASGNGTIIARRAIQKGLVINCVIDSDQNKHGRYIPTTDLTIVSPIDAKLKVSNVTKINLIIASQLHSDEISSQAKVNFHGTHMNIIC